MNLDSILNYCAGLKGSMQDFPFDEHTLAMKVMGKIYALIDVEKANYINLKCDPERAILLREAHSAILPGYHMNKKHWNSVNLNQDLDDTLIQDLIHHSYELVVKSLPKKLQNGL